LTRHKVLAIGLDGLEVTLAERLMAEGQMPALANLRKRAARFLLDQGPAQRTGLPWEHVASGLSPEAGRRWSPLEFDPTSYDTWQEGARFTPWWGETDLRVVVFDPPSVDLRRARNTQGIVAWGAHSPGTGTVAARPAALLAEFEQRFGQYPAAEWTYGTPWPSAARSRLMGEALCEGLRVRSRAAQWLAAERFPEWDFFFAVASELHAGVEGLWHGVDPSHPLNSHPSAGAADRALVDIHRALDQMVGQLVHSVGDAVVMAFNMGGMGPNLSDIQSMVLLPELLYRHAFGHSLLTVPPAWTAAPNSLPMLDEHQDWQEASASWVPELPREPEAAVAGAIRAIARRLPAPIRGLLKGARSAAADWRSRNAPVRTGLGFLLGNRYRHHWPQMPAFALPSFLDGRIRINLRGRERLGIVEPSRYEETCRTLETLLGECRDPRTGEPSVATIERASTAKPLALTSSESDLLVIWRDVAAALEHPRLGLIGPVPLRRTGGHNRHGVAYLAAPGLEPGKRGVRSAFDVAPTIVQLLGVEPPTRLTGKSLLSPQADLVSTH
jgi:predicted AlkP superfamily phosphohydrolase/phosphomutase